MEPTITHPWNLSESEAIILQNNLALKVIREDLHNSFHFVAGIVVLDTKTLQMVEAVVTKDKVQFAYIPGLFSFRELPPIIKALKQLKTIPDLILCDGQGIAHPRRFGLASHLGVLFDIPTIGCGKTKLIGEANEPEKRRGEYSPLIDKCEVIGNVLRTQDNTNSNHRSNS